MDSLGGGPSTQPGGKPPDERTVKLGKSEFFFFFFFFFFPCFLRFFLLFFFFSFFKTFLTKIQFIVFSCSSLTLSQQPALRILQERLPTLLQSPLPSEILAPTISLHLFPSTHPHLPVVSGRVAYIAALWTSPIAWNRVPLIGNVKLEILSERMTKEPLLLHCAAARRAGAGDEQLVVRWRTIGKGGMSLPPSIGSSASGDGSAAPVGTSQAVGDPKEFTGLFIFEFDGEGRVLSHTIEHVAEGGDWTRSVGARFVGLTDWLLGGIKGGGQGDGTPLPAFEMQDPRKLR